MADNHKVMKDRTGQGIWEALRQINDTLGARERGTVYGFHIDSTESDPSACVTYIEDAAGMAPAHMDYANGIFDWGGWRHAFFLPRPCMLRYDGTVDYYLDEYDHSKREDGVTASDVADASYAGNAMMEWGRDGRKIWYKVVPDQDPTSCSVYIADYQADEDYVCWPFVNNLGDLVDHFYTPMYFGTLIDGRLRSLSGQSGENRSKNQNAAAERTAAKANNPAGLDMWDTEVYCDVILINLLLVLMGKSLDTQTVFGQGLHTSGSDAVNNQFVSGQHDAKGLFWGANSGAAATYANAVKVFGMENWWGFMWRRFAGLVNRKGTMRYKLTKGTTDGTTATDYVVSATDTDYDGYLTGGVLPAAPGAYVQTMRWEEDGAHTPTTAAGDSSHNYCDGLWTNNGQVDYAAHGGASSSGLLVGAFYLYLSFPVSLAYWSFGAAPSCKPQS